MTQGPGKAPHKYRHIADDLRARIAAGEFPVGTQIPSIDELRVAYDAAKGTVEDALAVLRELGLVETRHGSGSFVLALQPGESEADQLSKQVAELKQRTEGYAELRQDVSRLESNLMDLYAKLGFGYPQHGHPVPDGKRQDRAVRHEQRA